MQDGGRLTHLGLGRDLPGPVPDSVVAELAYLAVFDAACAGVTRIVTDLEHPALSHLDCLLRPARALGSGPRTGRCSGRPT